MEQAYDESCVLKATHNKYYNIKNKEQPEK